MKQLLLKLYVRFKGSPYFLNRAIRKAKKLHFDSSDSHSKRKRYRVFFLKNRYEALTREDIQRKKHAKEWGWHVNSTSMDRHCFFDTDSLLPLKP
ncbi:MAG: hypothetical protein ABFD76_15210 [Smithella sp.]